MSRTADSSSSDRQLLTLVIVVAASLSACSAPDLCAEAVAHVDTCTGQAQDWSRWQCTPEIAGQVLTASCEELQASRAAGGKADGWLCTQLLYLPWCEAAGKRAFDVEPPAARRPLSQQQQMLRSMALEMNLSWLDAGSIDAAPDPTQLLLDAQRINRQSPPGSRLGLRVASYNVGLLDLSLLSVPGVKEREPKIGPALRELDADIVLLQELWKERSVEAFKAALADRYHFVLGTDQDRGKHGLAILIKRSLLPDCCEEMVERLFETQAMYETGFGFHKGALGVRLTPPALGRPIYIVNMHMTAMPWQSNTRLYQVDELAAGLIAPLIEQQQGLLILGGDTNASPYYADYGDLAQLEPWQEDYQDWWLNAGTYQRLIQLTETLDSFAAVHGDIEVATARAETVVTNGYWKTQSRDSHLTANISASTKTEPSQRLDYVLVRPLDPDLVTTVQRAEVLFRQRPARLESGEAIELSDHYLYQATLSVSW
jgi:endonuclease/exonuclease/phosphatase family metal-dependent hydrolase